MPREGRPDHHLFVIAGLVIHDLSLPLAGGGSYPSLSPPLSPALDSPHPSSMRTRAADRLYLGTRGAAPEVPAERTRVARCSPARLTPAGPRTSLRGSRTTRLGWNSRGRRLRVPVHGRAARVS